MAVAEEEGKVGNADELVHDAFEGGVEVGGVALVAGVGDAAAAAVLAVVVAAVEEHDEQVLVLGVG